MRRVVITGLGMVTPLGCGVEHNWAAIKAGKSGIRRIESIPVDDIACQIAGVIPRGDGTNGTFNPDHAMDPKDQRKVDDFIIFALEAARQAVEDSGWQPTDYDDQVRSGVLVGSGIGGINGIVEAGYTLRDKGPRRVSPFFIPGRLINLTAGYISIAHGYKGPNSSVVTACSTGSHAIGDAARLIANDEADVMIAGGSESPICRLSLAGFASMKALCFAFNDRPELGSRPYDRDRDGFVMGEGAGVVIVEELEHAQKRGATIYGEIVGYGMSGDAYHITAPSEDGDGAYRCMKAALRHAKISPEEIGYVNAHGTSTMADGIEVGAVERLFGDAAKNLAMSSTKSMTGHLLGAAGAIEAIYTALAVRDSILPPTINLDNPNVETQIDLVPHKAKEKKLRYALSNSFGFGGTNASLILKAFEG